MKQRCLFVLFLALLLFGFAPAQDNVVDIKHETIAIYADDTSLPSIQAKGDVVRVTVLGAWVSDGDDNVNHVISLSTPEVRFHNEYYSHKDDEIRMYLTVIGPTKVSNSTDWLPVTKGFQYTSYFGFQGLNSFFVKGIYEAYFYIETKSAGAGTALSARCLVKFK